MKNTILNSIKVTLLAAIIVVSVSYVSAFTTPGTFPAGQVPAVINTDTQDQIKEGGILSEKYFLSDLSFFTKTLLPGNDSWVNIGGIFRGDINNINNGGSTIPLTFDLTNRTPVTKSGTQGQNAINFISGQTGCATATAFINDRSPAFEFTSTGTSTGHADLIAQQIQLSGGNPQENAVLAAVDNQGNAVWAKLVVENGVLKVKDSSGRVISDGQTQSPVVTDANCSTPPIIPGAPAL